MKISFSVLSNPAATSSDLPESVPALDGPSLQRGLSSRARALSLELHGHLGVCPPVRLNSCTAVVVTGSHSGPRGKRFASLRVTGLNFQLDPAAELLRAASPAPAWAWGTAGPTQSSPATTSAPVCRWRPVDPRALAQPCRVVVCCSETNAIRF